MKKRFLLLTVDSTDEFNEEYPDLNLVNINSEHGPLSDAIKAFEESVFSNKYLVQIIKQDINI